MENKFKQFLISEFQNIPPSLASAEYRKQLLQDLLDYAQELKIKGITNDEVIYDLAIKKLGNMQVLLQEFERDRLRTKSLEKKKAIAIIASLSILLPSLLVYLVASLIVVPPIWSWSWIILLGGIFAWITTLSMLYMINNKAKLKKLFIRASVLAIVTLWAVFAALVLMLVNNNIAAVSKWYTVFIAIPGFLALADIAVSLATNSKGKWLSVAADIVIFYVILYVILTLLIPGFSHPGWLLILLGVGKAGVELVIVYKVKSKKLKAENISLNEIDEKYYTQW